MNGDCLSFIDHHEGNCTEVIGVEKVEVHRYILSSQDSERTIASTEANYTSKKV